jgi:hypothetical protein
MYSVSFVFGLHAGRQHGCGSLAQIGDELHPIRILHGVVEDALAHHLARLGRHEAVALATMLSIFSVGTVGLTWTPPLT